MDDPKLVADAVQRFQFFFHYDVVRRSRSIEDRQVDVQSAVHYFLGHGSEGCDSDAARQRDHMISVAQGLIVELPQPHGSGQNIADLQLVIDIVADEAVALGSSHRDLHKRMLSSGLEGRGGNGIRSRDQAFPDLKIEYDVLPCIEEGKFAAVCPLEPDRLRRLAGRSDLCDHKLNRAWMPGAGHIADRIYALERGGR